MLLQSLVTSNRKKLHLIKIAACCFFLIGILMTKNLWSHHRNFPTIPLLDISIPITVLADTILYYLLLILLTFTIILKQRVYIFSLFILLFFFLMQDQMRWHPWVYIYVLVLVPFLMKPEKNNHENVINYLQILFIGIYLWSGIHKFNANFIDLIAEGFAKYFFKISNVETLATFKNFGYVFPSMEIFAALLLVFPRTRKIGLCGIIFMHLFIIIYVSPLGMNYNYIIIPWNIFMIIAGVLLYYNSKRFLLFSGGTFVRKFLTFLVFLVLALPSLNFLNYWDSYMSFSFFSGKIDNYYVLSKDSILSNHSKYEIKDYITTSSEHQNGEILYIDAWANNVLNVPMYPEERLFKKIAQSFCSTKENSSDFIFLKTNIPLWRLFKSKKTNSQENPTNYKNQVLFFKFKKDIKNEAFDYFVCEDLNQE